MTTATFDGVILSSGDFIPSEKQVRALETALPRFVKDWLKAQKRTLSSPLKDYKRTYRGLKDSEGREIVVVDFFHSNTDVVRSGEWMMGRSMFDGGGEYYLEARYDTHLSRLVSFWINAPL